MADQPRDADADNDAGTASDRRSTTGAPRWVRVVGIIALGVVLLFVIVLFTRGPGGPGGHSPGRHTGLAAEHALPFEGDILLVLDP
ncbi:hypothetical protein BH24ACT13_BH24ACT13_07680 [soil metagenome]|jgi:hypothetical protein